MRKSVLIFLICLYSIANSQTLNRLDISNGFRKFKFGMSPSQFSNLAEKKSGTNPRDVKYYSYSGKDISEFNGVAIEAITVGFYKNRLFGIQVEFGTVYKEYTASQFAIVQEGLENNFGTDFHKCDDMTSNETNCAIWDGNRVRLESIRFNLSEKDGTRKKEFNYLEGYILFTEKKIKQEQQNSEIEQ